MIIYLYRIYLSVKTYAMLLSNDDTLFQIVQHVDIVSFIYLMMTCKQLYNMRKYYFKHIVEGFKGIY